jgi:hypothetical protein
MDLELLFDNYGSDKGTLHEGHRYAKFYEELIPRNTKTLLEIGIGTEATFNGTFGSIRAWLDWLPDAHIYGFDFADASEDLLKNDRFHFIKGDQSNKNDLYRLYDSIPNCDIIIDDGSHINSHQILSFFVLWEKVNPNGYYIIEDIHCKWGDPPFTTEVLGNHPDFYKFIGNRDQGMVFKKRTKYKNLT